MDITTTFSPDSFEAKCLGGLSWAWYGLGECIRSTRDKVSIAFGILSIAAWFAFGFPQMVTNCVKKIPDEAVSPWLLLFWLLGDSLNLIGAFLTNQLFLQKVLAGYTVVVDLILIAQYVYYLCLHKHKIKISPQKVFHFYKKKTEYGEDYNHEMNDTNSIQSSTSKMSHSSTATKTLTTALLGVFGVSYFYLPAILSEQGKSAHLDRLHLQGRQLLQAADDVTTITGPDPFAGFLASNVEKIGYTIGWIGAAMYFASRVPQIMQNFKRKSTEGLSLYLFLLAIFGNIFYGLQIFIKSVEPADLVRALPWILGSLGILIFDFIVSYTYRHQF
ncbi:unnamed protein product [Dibothriocephalus latus]|uniref:PQ-loop repeat-containing protein 2 n=1 Tax=Dibothriocephalus latus TaxID=60516 RepID=A0A3P6VDI1_DIBLA|nr:unnamed protein product [Dibothriocephalus latus]